MRKLLAVGLFLLAVLPALAQGGGQFGGGAGTGVANVDCTATPGHIKKIINGVGTCSVDAVSAVNGVTFTWTNPASGDLVTLTGAATGANAIAGLPTSRTDATANVTYSCSTDKNAVVYRTDAAAMTDTLPAAGASCPDGRTIFAVNSNTVVADTITLQTGSTAVLGAQTWNRLRSNGSSWDVAASYIPDAVGKIPTGLISAPLYTAGSGALAATVENQYIWCTGACQITPLTPVAGRATQLCVFNDDNIATIITLNGIASVSYEATARTSYGVANHTFTSGGAVKDGICIVARDATHYNTVSFTGTWTLN